MTNHSTADPLALSTRAGNEDCDFCDKKNMTPSGYGVHLRKCAGHKKFREESTRTALQRLQEEEVQRVAAEREAAERAAAAEAAALVDDQVCKKIAYKII